MAERALGWQRGHWGGVGGSRGVPGTRVAQLVHVGVVLGQDGDGVTLLADDQPGLLFRGVPQVYTIKLERERESEREKE